MNILAIIVLCLAGALIGYDKMDKRVKVSEARGGIAGFIFGNIFMIIVLWASFDDYYY